MSDSSTKLSRRNPSFSPLEPIFFTAADAVPRLFREQFYVAPEDLHDVVLVGRMHQVWYRPRWLYPVMWVAGILGILVPRRGRNIPMTLRVTAKRDRAGRPIHTWARTFYFPDGRDLHFNTSIVYDPIPDHTADLVGPADTIYIQWKARFRPPNVFTLDTASVGLRVGRVRLRLPKLMWQWLFGVVHHSQWIDPWKDDVLHVELMLWHPLVGLFFGYEGTFRFTQQPRTDPTPRPKPDDLAFLARECKPGRWSA